MPAFKIDDEPNADLIDFIAGYDARGGLYRYFRTVEDLLGSITSRAKLTSLPRVELEPGEIDLAEIIPQTIGEYPVHVESGNRSWRFLVWQKVNGGMRSIMLKRVIPRISFLTGVLLYAGEGTKSAASGEVEISNSSANILRLFIGFLGTLGVPPERLKARIQIHEPIEESTARSQ